MILSVPDWYFPNDNETRMTHPNLRFHSDIMTLKEWKKNRFKGKRLLRVLLLTVPSLCAGLSAFGWSQLGFSPPVYWLLLFCNVACWGYLTSLLSRSFWRDIGPSIDTTPIDRRFQEITRIFFMPLVEIELQEPCDQRFLTETEVLDADLSLDRRSLAIEVIWGMTPMLGFCMMGEKR